RFEQVRRNLARLVSDLSTRNCTRSPRNRSASTRISSQPIRRGVSIAFFDEHTINRKSELFGDDLRVSCFVTLPLRLRSETRNHFAGWMNTNLRTVKHLEPENVEMLRWTSADNLRETADANAHQLTARAFLGLLFLEFGVSDAVHRELQGSRVVAAVIFPIERRLIRKLLRLDE